MRLSGTARVAIALSAICFSLVGCTSVLGDYEIGSGPDSSFDGSLPDSSNPDTGKPGSDGQAESGGGGDATAKDAEAGDAPLTSCQGPGGLIDVGTPCAYSTQGKALTIPSPPRGACHLGLWECVSPTQARCVGAVGARTEDCTTTRQLPADDEDCDGNPINDCACLQGQTRPCGTDVGECKKGTQTCAPGNFWGPCTGAIEAIARDCTSLNDYDCNGTPDKNEASCNCQPGNVAQGASGTCTASGVGECAHGSRTCSVDSRDHSIAVFTACIGTPAVFPPVCTGTTDATCNGVIDYREDPCVCRDSFGNYKAPKQRFQNNMVGCAGSVDFASRAQLCNPNCRVCNAAEWVARYANVAPSHHYWTNDMLRYSANGVCNQAGWTCTVSMSPTNTNDCGAATPMRVCNAPSNAAVCSGSITDPSGNLCNWIGCGLDTATSQYFGGCAGNNTAGTLCCCD